jgi:ATP-dependent Clp protease protease subunit
VITIPVGPNHKDIEEIINEMVDDNDYNRHSLNDDLRRGLLEEGTIMITDSIGTSDVYELERELRYIQKHFPRQKDITVLISSYGGAAYAALALYDRLRQLSRAGYAIRTEVLGVAASAAAMIVLQAGDKRIASPLSRFLLHEVRQWSCFETKTTSNMTDEAAEMKAITDAITTILAERCHKTKAEVEKSFERKELWMSAKQALEYGLIDEIK